MRVKNPLGTMWRILVRRAPIEAQLIVTRRCNLTCGYCTEYDQVSPEIPYETLCSYIDALHRLDVVNISMLGGEPLLHSRIADLVSYANRHSQVSVTTNGFLLSDALIEKLNEAGLSNMQVSIDTLYPDATLYIQKSMKTLAPKLERLQKLARFTVHVNVVLCENSKDQFKAILSDLRRYGFYVAVNLVHDDRGMVQISGQEYLDLWNFQYEKGTPISYIEHEYGQKLLSGQKPDWKCRAGSRYLYVDEFGKAQFCSAQRGRLDKPIVDYTVADLREHAETSKGCEEGCGIFCVYRSSQVDNAPLSVIGSVLKAASTGALFQPRHHAPPFAAEDVPVVERPVPARNRRSGAAS